MPDLTLLFDVTRETVENRLAKRGEKREFFEQIDFLMKVREKYLESSEKLSKTRKIIIIDSNGGVDEVFEHVRSALDEEFGYQE